MKTYTYFITSPGYSEDSYIVIDTGSGPVSGNYFKFGDSSQLDSLDIRSGYATHNPDIGIFAVLHNDSETYNLGTAIKASLQEELGMTPVSGEWFFADSAAIERLRKAMQKNDGLAFDIANTGELLDVIQNALQG